MDQLILLCKNDDPVPGNRLDLPYITQEEREEILEFRKKEMEKFENAKKIENGYDHEVESIQAESIKNQKGLASDNTTDDKWLRTQSIVLAEVPPKEEPNITKEKRSAKKVDEEKADAHLKRIQRRKAQFENQISKYKNWIIIIISLTIPIVIVSIVFGIAFIINPNEIANVVAIDFFLAVLCLIIIIYYYLRNKIQSINQELDEL
jgi:cation transport ATPase